MRSNFRLLIALTVLATPACVADQTEPNSSSAASGVRVSNADLCNFRYGVSTPGDVKRVLGEPQGSSSTSVDGLLLVYFFMDPSASVFEQVTFSFKKNLLDLVQRSHVGSTGPALPECLVPQP
jgi:hypothetical protein